MRFFINAGTLAQFGSLNIFRDGAIAKNTTWCAGQP